MVLYNGVYFPGGSDGKASAYNVGDPRSIPGLARSGEGNGNPLQYSCLENPMDGGACRLQSMGWQSRTRLSDFTFTFIQWNTTQRFDRKQQNSVKQLSFN